MHLTFWQPTPSLHQRGLLEALVSEPWVKSVRLRYESAISNELLVQERHGGKPTGVDVAQISEGENAFTGIDQVNIFSGFLNHVGVWAVFKRIPVEAPGIVFAYAEAPELSGFAGLGRFFCYRLAAWRLRNRLDAILALGESGTKYYRGLLGDRLPIIEFAYYDRSEHNQLITTESKGEKTESVSKEVPTQETTPNVLEHESYESYASPPPPELSSVLPADINIEISGFRLQDESISLQRTGLPSPGFSVQAPKRESADLHDIPKSRVSVTTQHIGSRHPAPMLGKVGALQPNTRRLLFVGECIWRKGLDNLLIALSSLPPSAPPWVLDVVGSGSEGPLFMELAESLDLVDKVRFRRTVTGAALNQYYLKADLVILPSRWDGWGMAVNEALFAGAPVAATDRCGAASVIKNLPGCLILPAGRTSAWPELLVECLGWSTAVKTDRARLQKAAERLTGKAGVEILRKTIEQARKSRN